MVMPAESFGMIMTAKHYTHGLQTFMQSVHVICLSESCFSRQVICQKEKTREKNRGIAQQIGHCMGVTL